MIRLLSDVRVLEEWQRTNQLLERIANALEHFYPEAPDTEITDVSIDDLQEPEQVDESKDLDEENPVDLPPLGQR